MKIACFSTKRYDIDSFNQANARFGHELAFFEARLTAETTALAVGTEFEQTGRSQNAVTLAKVPADQN